MTNKQKSNYLYLRQNKKGRNSRQAVKSFPESEALQKARKFCRADTFIVMPLGNLREASAPVPEPGVDPP